MSTQWSHFYAALSWRVSLYFFFFFIKMSNDSAFLILFLFLKLLKDPNQLQGTRIRNHLPFNRQRYPGKVRDVLNVNWIILKKLKIIILYHYTIDNVFVFLVVKCALNKLRFELVSCLNFAICFCFQLKAPAFSVDLQYDGVDIKIFGSQSLKSELCGLCGSFDQVWNQFFFTFLLVFLA